MPVHSTRGNLAGLARCVPDAPLDVRLRLAVTLVELDPFVPNDDQRWLSCLGVGGELAKRSGSVHGRLSLLVPVVAQLVTQWHRSRVLLAQAGDLLALRVVDDQVMPLG
jgi:hypothetical protein